MAEVFGETLKHIETQIIEETKIKKIKIPNKPLLKCDEVKKQAHYTDSKDLILEYLNKDKPDSEKRSELPDTVHSLWQTSNYNMSRQLNRLKKRVGISAVNENLKEITVLVPELEDQTKTKFSMETSQFVFEHEADIYLTFKPNLRYLNE